MNKYPSYQESNIEWIGEVPSHWTLIKNKYLLQQVAIRDKSDEELLSIYRDYGVVPRYSRDDNFNRPAEDLSNYKLVKKGFLVINKMKAWQGSMAISDLQGIVSPAYITCEPIKEFHGKYLHHLLRSQPYIQEWNRLSQGVRPAQWDLSFEDFGQTLIPLPPLPEQQAIADFLDRKTAQIDTLIEKKQRQIDLLQEQRTALINHVVTKGLNPDVKMKDSGMEWLGEIPSHWRNVRLKFLTREIIDTEHKTAPFFDDGEYFVVRTSNIRNGKLIFENAKYTDAEGYEEWTRRGVPEPGDVIFTREAPAGEACIVPDNLPIVIGQRTVLFRLKKELFDAEFCIWSIYAGETSEFIRLLSQGSTVAHFNMSDIRDMPFLIPPIEEQKAISSYITSATNKIDSGIEKAVSQINNLKEYRTALISEAVTGKIDVR